jgi:DNA-binding transcriptional LysR family regulator
VADVIDMKLKEAAVALADTGSYDRAAAKLGITTKELMQRIWTLEITLCLIIFLPEAGSVELTDDGRFFMQAFRETLIRHKQG